MKEIKGKKVQMSQVFAEDGRVIPVTLIKFAEFPQDLTPGTPVRITGVSKGKGFAGVVKRWGFAGGPATHGQSDRERAPGSIGQRTTPGRVHKGKRMAGRMGMKKVTLRGLSVVEVDLEAKIAKLSGAVPGPRGREVVVRYEPSEVRSQESGASSDRERRDEEETGKGKETTD